MTSPGEFDQVIIAYFSDDGETYTISMKAELALALDNPIVETRTNQGVPEKWRFRTITIVTVLTSPFRSYQRELIVSDPNNPYFLGTTNTINIGGTTWRITARRGEKRRGPFAT